MVGDKYANCEQLKECIRQYGLAKGYSLWFEKSTKKLWIARCGTRPPRIIDESKGQQMIKHKNICVLPDCPWTLYDNMLPNEASFQVKTMHDVHTCSRNFKYGYLINYKWIAKQFCDQIRLNPEIKLTQLTDLAMLKYKCELTPNQCSRDRRAKMGRLHKKVKTVIVEEREADLNLVVLEGSEQVVDSSEHALDATT